MNKKVLIFALIFALFTKAADAIATTYYYEGTGALNTAANWNTMPDGSGTSPASFAGGHTWIIQNGQSPTFSGSLWTMGGGNSKLIVDENAQFTWSGGVVNVRNFYLRGTYYHNTGSTTLPGNDNYLHSGNNGSAQHGTAIIQDAGNAAFNPNVEWGNLTFAVASIDIPSAQGRGVVTVKGNLNIVSGVVILNNRLAFTTTTIDGNVTINSGATLYLSTRNTPFFVNLGGNLTVNGTLDRTPNDYTTVYFNGASSNFTIDPSATLNNGTINWQINNGANTTLNGSLSNAAGCSFTMTPTSSLTLTSNSVFRNNGTADFNNQLVVLKSDASGTAMIGNSANAIVDATNVQIERYIPNRRAWRLLAAPLVAASAPTILNAWQEGTSGSNPNPGYGTWVSSTTGVNGYDGVSATTSMKFWNINNWGLVSNTNATKVTDFGGAWYLFVRGDKTVTNMAPSTSTTLRMKGEIQQGNVSGVGAAGTSMSLIPNPYACAVDYEAVFTGNGSNPSHATLYIWDANLGSIGGYRTITRTGVNTYTSVPGGFAIPQYIESGQAFFVAANTTLNFTEDMKVTGAAPHSVYKSTPASTTSLAINLLSVNKNDALLLDGVSVQFADEFSNTPSTEDVLKMENINENLSINHHFANYAIDKRQSVQGKDIVPLRFWNTNAKNYQLQFEPTSFPATVQAFLIDAYTQTTTAISTQEASTYNFDITADPASQGANRFSVVFENARTVNSAVTNSAAVTVYPNPLQGNGFYVVCNNLEKGNYTVQVTSITGAVVYTTTIQHDNANTHQVVPNTDMPAGVYHVVVKNNNGATVAVQKITK